MNKLDKLIIAYQDQAKVAMATPLPESDDEDQYLLEEDHGFTAEQVATDAQYLEACREMWRSSESHPEEDNPYYEGEGAYYEADGECDDHADYDGEVEVAEGTEPVDPTASDTYWIGPSATEDWPELCRTWESKNGKCKIFKDTMTSKLAYEEAMGDDGGRLFGFLRRLEEVNRRPLVLERLGESPPVWFQAEIFYLGEGDLPWYGPSFGEKPDKEGDIEVVFIPSDPARLETRIRVADEDEEWQPPTVFSPAGKLAVAGSVFVFGS